MGADIVGWISCPLQANMKRKDFFWKIKLLAAKTSIEKSFAEGLRADIEVKLLDADRRLHALSYAAITSELGDFAAGIPECATCPVSEGKTLGCNRYIPYPIDEQFERLVFEYFVSQFLISGSICNQIYQDIVSHFPSSGTPWHIKRGSADALALIAQPLLYEWGAPFSKRSLDSAQVLGSLFISLESPTLVVSYSKLFMHILDYAEERSVKHTPTLDALREALSMYVQMVPLALNEDGTIMTDS